jgi:hypothetical protein
MYCSITPFGILLLPIECFSAFIPLVPHLPLFIGIMPSISYRFGNRFQHRIPLTHPFHHSPVITHPQVLKRPRSPMLPGLPTRQHLERPVFAYPPRRQ